MGRSRSTSGGSRSTGPKGKAVNATVCSLMVRLDQESKTVLQRAAALRRISVSDQVRAVTVTQARKEVQAAEEQTLVLTAEEQLAFWKALNETPTLTATQEKLGSLMRGET
jgi:uncharacterized protein (DUF1778 family)